MKLKLEHGKNKANADIRKLMAENSVSQKQLAEYIDTEQSNLNRALKRELSDDSKASLAAAIYNLIDER